MILQLLKLNFPKEIVFIRIFWYFIFINKHLTFYNNDDTNNSKKKTFH